MEYVPGSMHIQSLLRENTRLEAPGDKYYERNLWCVLSNIRVNGGGKLISPTTKSFCASLDWGGGEANVLEITPMYHSGHDLRERIP